MIATWMLYATLVGLFVSLASHALDRGARTNGLPSRFIWLAAMVATLLVPVIGYSVRRASLNRAAFSEVVVGRSTALEPTTGDRRLATGNPFATTVAKLRAMALRVDREAALIWAAFTLVLLGRLAFATGMLWRNRRTWAIREIDGTPIFVTPDLGPAVVALPRSEILFPEWLLSLDDAHIAMVLRHEREHRAAGDPRLLVAAAVLTALVPWNAALWWQMRRLRLAVEMDCDARVLRADPRVDRYGSLLLAIAQHPRAALYAAATLTESTSNLERRIDAMTRSPASAPRRTAALLVAFAGMAVFAACVTPAPDVVAGPRETRAAKAPANSLFEFEVAQPATVDTGNVPPRYPDELRAARIGGVVVAKFVVDTDGRADMTTLVIVKSDHDLFANTVRQSLPSMRFVAARMGDRRVRQLMQMPFVFSLDALAKPGLSEVPVDGVVTAVSKMPRRALTKSEAPGRAHVIATEDAPPDRPLGDTVPPRAIPGFQYPAYPAQLRAANIEAHVTARFVVRADGTVGRIDIVQSDHDLFSNSVRDAVKAIRFSPATVKGRAVDYVISIPFTTRASK